jgi:hypothetical protein
MRIERGALGPGKAMCGELMTLGRASTCSLPGCIKEDSWECVIMAQSSGRVRRLNACFDGF